MLNHMFKGYVRDIPPPFSNEFHEVMCCPIAMKI
jgi:hypothetical protein